MTRKKSEPYPGWPGLPLYDLSAPRDKWVWLPGATCASPPLLDRGANALPAPPPPEKRRSPAQPSRLKWFWPYVIIFVWEWLDEHGCPRQGSSDKPLKI